MPFTIGRLGTENDEGQLSTLRRHNFYQIIWITQGTGTFAIDFDAYPIQPNTAFFTAPGEFHAIRDATEITGFAIEFTTSFLRLDIQRYSIFSLLFFRPDTPPRSLQLNEADGALFLQNIQHLEQEFRLFRKGHVGMVQAYMHILLATISRLLLQSGAATPIEITPMLQEFVDLVEAHFRERRHVSEYAKLLFVTPDYLNDHVKQRLNKTASEFIKGRVLLEAKRLLVYSDEAIIEIARYLGFDHSSYFSKFFKRYTGYTPQQFRVESQEKYRGAIQASGIDEA